MRKLLLLSDLRSQVSHRMGIFRTYFRHENLNVNHRDPLLRFYGRRNGPLAAIRWDAGNLNFNLS